MNVIWIQFVSSLESSWKRFESEKCNTFDSLNNNKNKKRNKPTKGPKTGRGVRGSYADSTVTRARSGRRFRAINTCDPAVARGSDYVNWSHRSSSKPGGGCRTALFRTLPNTYRQCVCVCVWTNGIPYWTYSPIVRAPVAHSFPRQPSLAKTTYFLHHFLYIHVNITKTICRNKILHTCAYKDVKSG